MNLQTYQQCISSLEKQIESRQKQRQQMMRTIQQLDDHLQSQINKNKQLKQEINHLMDNNDSLLMQLHQKQSIIEEREDMINQSSTSDNFMKQKVNMLETQKKYLQQELKDRDLIISQKTSSINQFQLESNKNNSLIQGYRNIVNQKAKIIAQLQTKCQLYQVEKEKLIKQIEQIKQKYEAQKEEMIYKIQHQSNKASDSVSQLHSKIITLKRELQQTKQLHINQINTLQFNHQQKLKQLQKQQSFLKNEITHYLQVIDEMKQHQKKQKAQYEKTTNNQDQIVNQLINEINFLKEEKVQTEKKKTVEFEEVTQKIIQIGLQKVIFIEKQKQTQQKLRNYQQQVQQLGIKLQQSLSQGKIYEEQLKIEKSTAFNRGQEIFELKTQIDKLNKSLQLIKKQKQSATNNTSVQLTILRQQNIDLQRTILNTQSQLQQQKIKYIQLQQSIKHHTYDKLTHQQSQSQLLSIITNHQTTIQQIQNLLQQSKKIINQLNLTLKVKLKEIQALQSSNQMFRKQKCQWIKKQDQYRKKIMELKHIKTYSQKERLNKTNIVDYSTSTARSYGNKAYSQIHKPSLTLITSPGGQNYTNIYSESMTNGNFKHKTINTPINWLQRLNHMHQAPYFPNQNFSQSSSSNQEISLDIQEPIINTESYRQSKNTKIKTAQSHQINEGNPLNSIMKKKDKKPHFTVQNGSNINGLKKDYSVGRINILRQRD